MVLNQRQEEIQRKKMEAEAVKENLEAQLSIVDKKKEELEHMQRQEIEKLEAISGLSAEEAKERIQRRYPFPRICEPFYLEVPCL